MKCSQEIRDFCENNNCNTCDECNAKSYELCSHCAILEMFPKIRTILRTVEEL